MSSSFDMSNLDKFVSGLSSEQQKLAFKGVFRRAAKSVRKVAISNLKHSIHTDRDLQKGIRSIIYRKNGGFRMTVGTKKNKSGRQYGFHRNRYGKLKPVLVWAELGTKRRRTKSKSLGRKRSAHNTGRMKQYGFMQKTFDETQSAVVMQVKNEVSQNIIKISKKYGCS